MARYIGPKSKIARRFGEAIFGADKVLSRRNFPPGQHGNNRRRKMSEYGVMLAEKQKAKYTYGVLERQFRNMFEKASKSEGITGEVLLQNLESRLDNVVFRMGIAPTRAAAEPRESSRQRSVPPGYCSHACSCSSACRPQAYRCRWTGCEYSFVHR